MVGLFVIILYALISYGMILATKQRITNAAAEGARAAVGQGANAVTAATGRVQTALGAPGKYAATYTTAPCGSNQCITVTITYDLAHYPVVPPAPGLGLVTPSTISSTAVVQYS